MSAAQPVVVVGNGIAGLVTALAAAPRPVILLGRDVDGLHSASVLAQGGIAAALAAGDRAQDHADDTCAAGAFHNDRQAVDGLTREAPAAVRWLAALGVEFDRIDDALALAREGGHSCARIAHAGGDASGARIMAALRDAARHAAHIEQRVGDVDVLRISAAAVSGARLVDRHGHAEIVGGEVVLATGGIGGLFARSTNPLAAQGSGLALGAAAGARLRDLEFVQFHPTALRSDRGGPAPLLTEALRGAGARLCTDDGAPLMRGVHPLGDLAPRDVVTRRIWRIVQAGGCAWLDATAVDGIEHRFPSAWSLCRAHGIDPRVDPIPVLPAAHYHMGGLQTDRCGRTRRPGLYAVGEVACTGVHGANRLASNSLLEAVVYGRRLGRWLRQQRSAAPGGRHWYAGRGRDATADGLSAIRRLMSACCGPVRNADGLLQATLGLQQVRASAQGGWQAAVAARIVAAAAARPHSLGAHCREEAVATQRDACLEACIAAK